MPDSFPLLIASMVAVISISIAMKFVLAHRRRQRGLAHCRSIISGALATRAEPPSPPDPPKPAIPRQRHLRSIRNTAARAVVGAGTWTRDHPVPALAALAGAGAIALLPALEPWESSEPTPPTAAPPPTQEHSPTTETTEPTEEPPEQEPPEPESSPEPTGNGATGSEIQEVSAEPVEQQPTQDPPEPTAEPSPEPSPEPPPEEPQPEEPQPEEPTKGPTERSDPPPEDNCLIEAKVDIELVDVEACVLG